jgi:hypothetical protein
MKPKETIRLFDDFLDKRGLRLKAVVIGGTALALLGVVSRQTRDCDVLDPQIPEDMKLAAREFAASRRDAGESLDDDWLNNGPASLIRQLPDGWKKRLEQVFAGKALSLHSLGRTELLMSKLFALCDRGIDIQDCIALAPTHDELTRIIPWLTEQDLNPDWPAHVRAAMADLAARLGHAV